MSKMKKTLVIAIIITLILGFSLVAIPKHEVPTDEEWETFLEYEEEFFRDSAYRQPLLSRAEKR